MEMIYKSKRRGFLTMVEGVGGLPIFSKGYRIECQLNNYEELDHLHFTVVQQSVKCKETNNNFNS